MTAAGAARVEQLAALAPHPGTAHHLAVTVEGPVVLARVAPGGSAFAARVVQAYDLLVDEDRRRAHDQTRQKRLLEDPAEAARAMFQTYLAEFE